LNGWIGVDLDGTLSKEVPEGLDKIGEPIPRMVALVRKLLEEGEDVHIFTARVAPPIDHKDRLVQEELIRAWCWNHLCTTLPITATKNLSMVRFYDDRAVQVETNTGRLIGEEGEDNS